jgi:hypothetical protein
MKQRRVSTAGMKFFQAWISALQVHTVMLLRFLWHGLFGIIVQFANLKKLKDAMFESAI